MCELAADLLADELAACLLRGAGFCRGEGEGVGEGRESV